MLLANDYLDDVAIFINGKPFRVKVGEERTVSVPLGDFDYQVPSIEPVVRRGVSSLSRPYTIRVRQN